MHEAPTTVDTAATRTAPFFALTLTFTLLVQSPAVLARYGVLPGDLHQYMGLVALGALGPMLMAIVLSRRPAGGIRALMRSLVAWRVPVPYYVIALFGLAAIYIVARALYGAVVPTQLPWLYPPNKPEYVIAMFMFPLVEEIGWRGYALPRLQLRYGAFAASALLGVAWALWHTMMFLSASDSPLVFVVGCLNVLVGSFAFTWLYNRTKGSLLLAVLLHMGAHLHNPSHAVPDITPLALQTAGLAVVVVALMLFDPAAWRPPFPALPAERAP